MVHTKRDNYKAKLEAALKSGRTANEVSKSATTIIENAVDTTAGTTLELSKLQHVMLEAASTAKNLLELMECSRQIGEVSFPTIATAIDGRLNEMSMVVIARRVRDALKLAEARIGILSAAYENSYEAQINLEQNIKTVETSAQHIQKVAINSLFIGPHATANEVEDMLSSTSAPRSRFGLTYEDLDDEWISTRLVDGAVLIEQTSDSSEEDSGDDGDSKPNTLARRRVNNRAARVLATELDPYST
jgi:hypothetical protein